MREGPFTKLAGRQWRLTPAQHRTLQKAAAWGKLWEQDLRRGTRTLSVLLERGLLRPWGLGKFRITPMGRQVLEAPAAWGLTMAQIDAYNRRHPRAR